MMVRPTERLARELLILQTGSIDEALVLLEEGYDLTEEEETEVVNYLDEIGNGALQAVDREIAVEE